MKRKKPQPGTTGPNYRMMSLEQLQKPRKRKPSPPAFDLEAARRKVEAEIRRLGDYSLTMVVRANILTLRWVLSEVLTQKGK